jgi:hypothetical protein
MLGDDGNGVPRALIINYITDPIADIFSISKLDALLAYFNQSPVKPIKKAVHDLIIERKPAGASPQQDQLNHILSYLQGIFELKFKNKLLDAFRLGFEAKSNARISE